MGFLRHITKAALTPPETHERRRDLLLSAGAMLAVAIVSAILARWLILGGLSEGWDALHEERRYGEYTQNAESLRHLLIGGGFAAFFALILLLAALATLAAALRRPQPRDP